MYEFTCKVMIDGEEDIIKTFAYSVIEAIDNLVQMTIVEDVFSLTRDVPKKTWDFKGNFKLLRELRNDIEDESLIIQEMQYGGKEEKSSSKIH